MRNTLLMSATHFPHAAAVNALCAAQPTAESTIYLLRPATHVHVDVHLLACRVACQNDVVSPTFHVLR